MGLTRWRRPKSFTLPGGFRVPISYLTRRQIIARSPKDASPLSAQDVMGFWDGKRIVICTDEPLWRQIEVLGHEVVHATHDYALWLQQAYAEPIKQECVETILEAEEE